jgi:ATP synthase F1 gamma subunit
MRRLSEIANDETMMGTLTELTGVFEGLASMRISQVKDQVLQSTKFYDELWGIYKQIRVGNQFSFGRSKNDNKIIDKTLIIVITAEGGFSGEIDQKLIRFMIKDYDEDKNEVIVVGRHGAIQLAQAHVSYKRYFKMPSKDKDINVQPIVNEIKQYESTTIYYQEYQSLLFQDVKKIEMSSAINSLGEDAGNDKDFINEKSYIFEPSTYEVVAHLERSMIQITVSQLILESKLAQYASRFQAMRLANDRASEERKTLHTDYNRAKRAIKDQRLKETVISIKKLNAGSGN